MFSFLTKILKDIENVLFNAFFGYKMFISIKNILVEFYIYLIET